MFILASCSRWTHAGVFFQENSLSSPNLDQCNHEQLNIVKLNALCASTHLPFSVLELSTGSGLNLPVQNLYKPFARNRVFPESRFV